jgi:hypothetical protein
MFLLKQPQEPPSSATYLYGHLIQEYQDWEPFINGW